MGRPKTPTTDVGAYLTNGVQLYYVMKSYAPEGCVMLEDVGDPDSPAILRTVDELLADGLTVVRPAA